MATIQLQQASEEPKARGKLLFEVPHETADLAKECVDFTRAEGAGCVSGQPWAPCVWPGMGVQRGCA